MKRHGLLSLNETVAVDALDAIKADLVDSR
jgi:hypothetical protein